MNFYSHCSKKAYFVSIDIYLHTELNRNSDWGSWIPCSEIVLGGLIYIHRNILPLKHTSFLILVMKKKKVSHLFSPFFTVDNKMGYVISRCMTKSFGVEEVLVVAPFLGSASRLQRLHIVTLLFYLLFSFS